MAYAISTVAHSSILILCPNKVILLTCVQPRGHGAQRSFGGCKKMAKPEIAAGKHQLVLADTGFKKCASCPGASSRLMQTINGRQLMMQCGNCAPRADFITVEQARQCDGTKPLPYNQKTKKGHFKPHPIFRPPEHRQ